ncbi:hypothetical protein [Mesorhizobium sp. SP-1A]|jgi:hypothetical protein|uniref:hypothetical protein n=1 Tax=Mesorhizobium sp. SP-1A TaxID=3077840 RepID=UPI0028F70CC9|nr:hypothetical protein [Mesorhizobium sp. SP-1A]
MNKILHAAILAISVAATAFPVSGASAQDLNIQIGPDGPKVRMRDNCDPRYDDNCYDRRDSRRDWREDRRDDYGEYRRDECTPDRALRKAERMGIRRARIESVGRRTINIIGRSRGDRVIVTFDRSDRWCPVLR